MSDTYYGKIEIGGQLDKELLELFIKTLDDELNETGLEEIKEKINEAVEGIQVLFFDDPDARDGQFENTQEFCKKHGLKFVVTSSSYYEYMTAILSFDGKEERYLACDTDDNPVIRKDEIISALHMISLYIADPSSLPLEINEPNESLRNIVKYLLETGCTNEAEALEAYIEREYPEPVEVPAFELI